MKELHNLITNTTSLVGYIAVLMFVGAYVGGDQHYALDPVFLKGSVTENGNAWLYAPSDFGEPTSDTQPVIITVEGRQYEARLRGKIGKNTEYRY